MLAQDPGFHACFLGYYRTTGQVADLKNGVIKSNLPYIFGGFGVFRRIKVLAEARTFPFSDLMSGDGSTRLATGGEFTSCRRYTTCQGRASE